jgi:hypothetical protein
MFAMYSLDNQFSGKKHHVGKRHTGKGPAQVATELCRRSVSYRLLAMSACMGFRGSRSYRM